MCFLSACVYGEALSISFKELYVEAKGERRLGFPCENLQI